MVTEKFLDKNPDVIFVFGDNLLRKGKGGAAKLRDHPQAIGFITKKYPSRKDEAYYTIDDYWGTFQQESVKLIDAIERKKDKTFLVSKIGSGLANKHEIFDYYIKPFLESIEEKYKNVRVLWKD